MSQPLHIKGARVWDGDNAVERDLYVKNGRIVSEKPNHAVEIDLEGYTLFPGLINAHDHLELNHFPRTKFREVYDNAHQWGEDVNARLNDEPFKTLRGYPLWDRVFIGGLKNLLCGATTVAHHNPYHKYLDWDNFPVNVLKRYGWSHSLHFDKEEAIQKSYRRTPKDVSWFIHLAEGTDEIAQNEYKRLKALGCVGENTVIIHGVGMTADDVFDAARIVRGIVWCPSTNEYLLGKTTPYIRYTYEATRPTWREESNVAIGSDSRLTAVGDLLDEMIASARTSQCDGGCVVEALTHRAAKILSMDDVGHLRSGTRADFLINLINFPSNREYLKLVATNSIPQIGDPDVMAKFPFVETVACTLDGVEKRMNVELARQVHRCTLKEQGLEVDALPTGKRFIFF